MVQLTPALERDLDKAAAGKIGPPPIEAFMSDSALQAAEDATRAASAPVHAEDLRPISKAEAARRTTFGGEILPSMPAPRRVIPAPFRRPTATGGAHGKSWHESVRADDLGVGDIIPDLGRVIRLREVIRREDIGGVQGVAAGTDVEVTGAGGLVRTFDAAVRLRVFRS